MNYCKTPIIAACFSIVFPLSFAWADAPVVDDSDRFAMMDEQAYNAPAAQVSKYDNGFGVDDDSPLVKEDHNPSYNEPSGDFKDSAKLIDKIQALQQELQELRGQLEVQAHDLKLLQQQQLSYYKDLDTRLGAPGTKMPQTNLSAPIAVSPKMPQAITPTTDKPKVAQAPAATPVAQTLPRGNPADEQISYLAAYELVKNKKFEEAIKSMQIFVQKYPRGGYTANAQYWLGELYLQKKDYVNAIAHFEVVLNQFPSSSKAADCTLKLGYAHAAAGNKQEATRRLQTVLKNYPNTPMAQLAQLKLETLNAL